MPAFRAIRTLGVVALWSIFRKSMGQRKQILGEWKLHRFFARWPSHGWVDWENHQTSSNSVDEGKFLIWLVVWNIFYFPIYWEYSSQLTFIFFRGVAQPPTSNDWNLEMFHHRGWKLTLNSVGAETLWNEKIEPEKPQSYCGCEILHNKNLVIEKPENERSHLSPV